MKKVLKSKPSRQHPSKPGTFKMRDCERRSDDFHSIQPLKADLQAAHTLIAKMRKILEASDRLISYQYFGWQNAGGPNECKHGIAEGIYCKRCDKLIVQETLQTFLEAQIGNLKNKLTSAEAKVKEHEIRAEKAEKKLEAFSIVFTVLACKGCQRFFKTRDMADGWCAQCLKERLEKAESDAERRRSYWDKF